MNRPAPNHRLGLVAALVASMLPGSALAYRPFDSTDAAVAPPGFLELELGPLGYFSHGPERFLVVPNVVANLGFLPRWELIAAGIGLVPVGGRADKRLQIVGTGLALKWMIREGTLQDKSGPSLATELGILLPELHGDPGAGAGWNAILSQAWPVAVLHVNALIMATRAHQLGLFGGVILEGSWEWPMRPVLEGFVAHDIGGESTYSGLVGAIWPLWERLSLDLGLRLARSGGEREFEVRAGLTWDLRMFGR